jgi:ABC-type arginine/histidine transport system permease subunit
LAWNFPLHCRRIAAQRAAGEAEFATLNEQLRPSALRPALPAAYAALDALMQTTSNAAAAISIASLMAIPFRDFHTLPFHDILVMRASFYHQMDALRMSQIGPALA